MYVVGHTSRRRVTIGMFSIVLFVSAVYVGFAEPAEPRDPVRVDALFSPGGGCEGRITDEINSAQKNICLQMHMFTSKPISEALVQAKKRGVDVRIILDKSQEKMTYGCWPILRRAGVAVYFDGGHEINNNKVLIIDRRVVITGSYNYTKAAEEKNAENLIIIENHDDVAGKFVSDFEQHLKHSQRASR